MDGARDIFWIKSLNGTFLALQLKAFGPKNFDFHAWVKIGLRDFKHSFHFGIA